MGVLLSTASGSGSLKAEKKENVEESPIKGGKDRRASGYAGVARYLQAYLIVIDKFSKRQVAMTTSFGRKR